MLALPLAAVLVGAAALVPAPSPPDVPAGRWGWPLDPAPAVVRGYDDVGRYAAGHRGVDLAAAPGQTVLAPAPGRVVFAGSVAGRGVVVLGHAGGLRTSFEPVDDPAPVGTPVVTGQPVASVSSTVVHCPTTCLHVGLRAGTGPDVGYLDPLTRFVLADPPVLLPLGRS